MKLFSITRKCTFILAFSLIAASCSGNTEDSPDENASNDTTSSGSTAEISAETAKTYTNINLFADGALLSEPVETDCTLSEGEETTCWEFEISGKPADYEVGPFCPTTISSGAEEGGTWFDGNDTYDFDGQFVAGLAELYDDDRWLLHDENGNVNINTEEQFNLVGTPNPTEDQSLEGYCIEGKFEYINDGEPITQTFQIPVQPVPADSSSTQAPWGVSYSGIKIDGPAPLDRILASYSLGVFDDCGGHFNPDDGYHMHGNFDCNGETVTENHEDVFGIALDGYGIYSTTDSEDLDDCGGHTDDELGYHYHASTPETNSVIGCLSGQIVSTGGGQGGPPTGGGGEGRPPR